MVRCAITVFRIERIVMKKIFSAGLILFRVVDGERLYLLLHYPHGHWDFVKGKIEEGESKQEAALRELEEETGLEADIMDGFEEQLSYVFRQEEELIEKTVYFLIAQTESEEIELSHEHIDFAWLAYNQAEGQLTFANAKEVLKKAELFIRCRS